MEISSHYRMNSKVCFSSVYKMWNPDKEQMKLWYIFHLFVGHEFLTKNRWLLLYVFHLFMGVWISGKEWMDFMVCFSSIYGAWISDKEQMNFIICFSSVYRAWISDKEWMNFMVCFSSVYGPCGVHGNMWQVWHTITISVTNLISVTKCG